MSSLNLLPRRRAPWGCVVAAFASVVLSGCALQAQPEAGSLRIDGVTVIDPRERTVRSDQSVYIADGTIRWIGSDAARAPAAAATVDGRGKFLVPGFWDMHSHVRDYMDYALELHLVAGVTAVRDMSADCRAPHDEAEFCIEDVRELATRIERGEQLGPRIVRMSGDFVYGPPERTRLPAAAPAFYYPGNAEEGREVARYWQRRGVDFIKTYNSLPRDAYIGLSDEARKLGLEVSGHIPTAVDVATAVEQGHRTIEHARSLLYDCSSYADEYHARMEAVALGTPNSRSPEASERLRRTLDEYDPQRCARLLKLVADNEVYYVPTHLTREVDARADEDEYRDDARLKYVMPKWRNYWNDNLADLAAKPEQMRSLYRRFFEHGLRITRDAHAAGVRILVGTDATDTMVFPGLSYQDELQLLQRAGMPPMDILRAATAVAAEYVGAADRYGAVQAGYVADLVLLDANPLEDIANTRRIHAVVFAGKLHDRAQLDSFLRETEARVRAASSALEDTKR